MTEVLSAVVCTRNRPTQVADAVRMLLCSEARELELIVVDQSDGRETEAVLASFLADPRLRYVRSATRGKGAALNEGLALARGRILVCTDDDCQAPPEWVSDMTRTLRQQPDAAILFCQVAPVQHDPAAGYVPTFQISADRSLRSIGDICRGLGLGAGMAVRREFVASAGGFDESFGPGGRFPSADEWDLSIRALLMGHRIYETAEITIIHDGFRTLAEGRTHMTRDWVALGAVCAKPLRAGYWSAAVLPLWLLFYKGVWPIVRDVISMRRPRGFRGLAAFVQGFASGFATRVDRKTLLFNRPR